jgi:hypothetical protein
VVRQLPPLPETADELRAIARTLGAGDQDLLLGERASEPVLRQTPLDRYRVVQFATHGLVSGDLPGLTEPALVLTPPKEASPDNDGLLTASKVAKLKLNAGIRASDGTISNQVPRFVLEHVVYGKREVELQFKAGADLQASATRLGRQIGDAKLKVSATRDGLSR